VKRKAGERFNPYGDWEDQDAVWELLEDVNVNDNTVELARARCVIPSKAAWSQDVCGEERTLFFWLTAFAPQPRSGRLAP
jgi:hypothetical protein